jgi:hypothetical protein
MAMPSINASSTVDNHGEVVAPFMGPADDRKRQVQ